MAEKVETFILTYLGYMSIHTLRASYSFSIHPIIKVIKSDTTYIGLIDAAMILALGLGHAYNAINHVKNKVRAIWISFLACAIIFTLIPLIAINQHFYPKTIILILMLLLGFSQSYSWPNLLAIVQEKYDYERQSSWLGFWATSDNLGNMLGLLIGNLIIINLRVEWYYGMYLASAFTLIIGIVIGFRIKLSNHQTIDIHNSETEDIFEPSFRIFWDNKSAMLLLGIFTLLKSVLFGILLWFPLYFHEIGLKQYSAMINISFNCACVLGSVILGRYFNYFQSKGKIMCYILSILVICFIILKFVKLDVYGFFVLAIILGGFLGGIYNIMATLTTISLANNIPLNMRYKYVGFISDVTMAAGNLLAAFTQIIIGFVVANSNYINKTDNQNIFVLFGVYQILALFSCLYLVKVQKSQAI